MYIFSTNDINSENEQKLVNMYKPIKYSLIKTQKNRHYSRNIKFIDVINLCLSSNIKYDHVLITRFDLLFQKNFEKSNIDLDKFNLVSILEREHLICDNFYLLPFSKLQKLHEISKK